MTDPRIIVALDYPSEAAALVLVHRLDPALCRLKVGKELFTVAGPDCVRRLAEMGFEVFLDLKFHDIPNTVAAACRAAARLGVWMLNVHALGGRAMLSAAREALAGTATPPKLIAVTLLTSMGEQDLREVGIAGGPEEGVLRLAGLARACGLDGVVCSAREAPTLRRELGPEFCLVTPGIRPARAAGDDQVRVVTPRDAVALGSNYLVIGRPITGAPDPLRALREIHQEITSSGETQ